MEADRTVGILAAAGEDEIGQAAGSVGEGRPHALSSVFG